MQAVEPRLEKDLMTLPAQERVALAEKLLSSLDSPEQSQVDAAWAREADDRIRAHDKGELMACEEAAVYKRLNKKYGR